ncbi:MAG: alpha/beta fold hydrolase [Synechococcaceae cyanobacterium]
MEPGRPPEPKECLRLWRPSGPPRGQLVAVHGIGGHGGQFAQLAERLVPRDWAVWAPDLPGHGHCPGRRGVVPSWEFLGDTVASILAQAAAATPAAPLLLLGHSLGGAVCVDLLLRRPALAARLRGLVLTNPALDGDGVARWRVLVAQLLAEVWPGFTLSTGIDMAASSRDPDAVERFRQDPLRHGRCSARLGAGFLNAAARVTRRAAELRLHLRVLQSGADGVTAPAAAERFFRNTGSADKTWRLYPRSRHELFDDLDREEALADLLGWLEIRAGDGG